MNKRNYELTFNVTTGKMKIPSINIYNTDKGIFNIKLFLEKGEGKNIVKLTHDEMLNYKALFQAVKSKTKNYVELEGILDKTENFFYYDLGSKFNDQVGVYNCQMFITDTKGTNDSELDDEVVTSVPFNYNVTASILTGLNAEITANPDLPVVENLINELKVLGGLTLEDPNTVFGDYEKKVDVPKKTLVEDGKIYLAKSDGTKIDNGTTLPVGGGGGNVTWESLTGKPSTFTPSSHVHNKSDITDFPTIPTKTSELNNDSGFLTSHQDLSNYVQKETGKGLSTNDFTTSEKEKLQGLNNYTLPTASATVLGGVKVGAGLSISNGVLSATGGGTADSIDWNNIQNKPSVFAPDTHAHSYNDLTEKPNIPSVVGLATESYVDTKVAEIVDSAPETLNTLNELSTALGNDPNFATTVANQIGTKASTEYVNAELAKKVSNEGYVATENNYTTAEKTKLQGIQEGANNYVHPEHHDASIITQDNMHRFITDAERQSWNNKSEFDGNYDKLINKPDIPTKTSQLQNDSNFITQSELANISTSVKTYGAKCDGVTDDTMAFESALSSDSSVIKIPKGTMLIRQGQSYISYGVKKKIVGEEGSIIKCDFDSCKHFLNLSINVQFENVTFDFNNKHILNAITFSKNVGLIRMKNVTFQNLNDTDSTKSTVIVNITDGEVDIDGIKFKNLKKRGNGSVADGGGNLTGLGYFPATERKGQIKNIVVNDAHNVNAEGQVIFEDVSGVYIAGDATNKDILIVENVGGTNFGKRLVKTQCSNIRIKNVCGYSDVGDSLSCVGIGDTSSQGDSEITQSNIIVENIYAMGKIILPISTSCKNVIFRNGFFDTDYCDIPGNTGGSRAFAVNGSDVSFENIIARTNVIGFIDNHPIESLKDVSGKNISFNNCSFTVKDATQVYGITTSYGKEAKLDNIKINNVDIIYGSAKMGIIDFSRGVFNNIDIDNLNVEYPNADANFSANGIILDKCNNTNIGKITFKSNSAKGLFEGIKANQCTNLTIDNVATDQNDPENKCRLLNIQNSTGVSVSNIKKGNYKYLTFNTCQDVFLSDVDSSKISNINSSINMGGSGSGTGLTTEQVQQLQQAHTHSTSPHAPSNAQRNSDITKEEIEAKLTGDITTHTHSEYTGGKKQRFITQQEYDSLSSTGQLDNNTVYNITDAPVGIVIKKVTQQQYDTESHDTNTLYVIVG